MRKKYLYLRFFLIILTAVLCIQGLVSIYHSDSTQTNIRATIKQDSTAQNWFYEVYRADRLIIKQEFIPGVQGRQFFQSKRDAEKIALLVVQKLEEGKLPSVHISELEEFNIKFKN